MIFLDWFQDFAIGLIAIFGGTFLFHLFWSFFFTSTAVSERVVHVEYWEDKK